MRAPVLWSDNRVQFPRLLAEIRAAGLSRKQYADLRASTDLTTDEIDDVLERAEQDWERLKHEYGHYQP